MKAYMQIRIRQLATSWVVAAGLLLSGSGVAMAATVTFNDTARDDTVTVAVKDFQGQFSLNGFFISGDGTQSSTRPETPPLTFRGVWLTPGVADQTGTRTIYLVEASHPNLLSDIFTYSWNIGGGTNSVGLIEGTFQSDVNDELRTLIPVGTDPSNIIVEGIRPVLFSLPFLSGALISDVDPVPVPGSLGLLASGLIWGPLLRRAGASKVLASAHRYDL